MAAVTESARQAANPVQDTLQSLSCCPAFYEQDWVLRLAEDSLHPGGEDLTRRTIAAMNLPHRAVIADLGCGTGTTAMMLARDHHMTVSAVDISAANIERAVERADSSCVSVRFSQADVHELPFEDRELDGVLAECSFSLFNEQTAVLAEIRRVLKPRGKLAITDMATGGALPDDIAGVLAPWTCLADAVDQETYTEMFVVSGFEIQVIADESAGLIRFIRMLKRKLLLLGAGAVLANGALPDFDLATVKFWLGRFEAEVEKGAIRYLRFNLQM